MSELFRPEAVRHGVRRLEGEVLLATSTPVRLLMTGLAATLIAATIFLCLAHYSRREAAPGWIIADAGSAQGAGLAAELYLPPRAIGLVRPGQGVSLMYQAYPYERFGLGHGVVESISPAPLASGGIALPGLEAGEPVFKARVRLDRHDLHANGQTLPLLPGMRLSAQVVVDRRSLMGWLVEPILAAGRR